MGKLSRDKGKDGEREVGRLLREYGIRAYRGASSQAGGDGETLPDVVVEGSPLWLEVKRGRQVNIRAALRQAVEESETHRLGPSLPAAVHRDDRGEWLITARLEDVLEEFADVLKRVEWLKVTAGAR